MVPGARLVILGKQGAGKGTQCVRLARHYVVPHISTGDMFRAAVQSGTDFGRRLQEYMESGELVPDDVTIGVVAARLEQDDTTTRGFILDGFPRNAHQAEELSNLTQTEHYTSILRPIDLPSLIHAVTWHLGLLHAEFARAMLDEHVEFLERTLVEQDLDALARGQFAALMLSRDALVTTAELGDAAPFVECVEDVLHLLRPAPAAQSDVAFRPQIRHRKRSSTRIGGGKIPKVE